MAENMVNLEANATSAFQKFAYVIMQNTELMDIVNRNLNAEVEALTEQALLQRMDNQIAKAEIL